MEAKVKALAELEEKVADWLRELLKKHEAELKFELRHGVHKEARGDGGG